MQKYVEQIVKQCENLLFTGATLCLVLDNYSYAVLAQRGLFFRFGPFLTASFFISLSNFEIVTGCAPLCQFSVSIRHFHDQFCPHGPNYYYGSCMLNVKHDINV